MSSEPVFQEKLSGMLVSAGLDPVTQEQLTQCERLYSLFVRWNSRINLSAIRDENSIVSRHFVESIAAAQALPVGCRSLLDFGSGSGFPGLPIALCRPELAVTLAESQSKKAAYLREAVRTLGLAASVYGGRAETLDQVFDCVVLRAVDRMETAVRIACGLVSPGGWLALMAGSSQSDTLRAAVHQPFSWSAPVPLAGGHGVLYLAQRLNGADPVSTV